jgi:hypothetical protein
MDRKWSLCLVEEGKHAENAYRRLSRLLDQYYPHPRLPVRRLVGGGRGLGGDKLSLSVESYEVVWPSRELKDWELL